jgi:hypothetical protein
LKDPAFLSYDYREGREYCIDREGRDPTSAETTTNNMAA